MPSREELKARKDAVVGVVSFITVMFAIMFAVNRNKNSEWGTWFGAMFMAFFASPVYLLWATSGCLQCDGGSFLQSSCFDFEKSVSA